MYKIPSKRTKRCRICGDVASGFNYNGLCCESCKVFFLRNAHNEKKLQCVGTEKCVIVISTRKNCAKCRLQKCFANEMILSDKKAYGHLIQHQNNTGHLLHEYIQKCFVHFDFNDSNSVSSILPTIPSFSTTQKKRFATELTLHESLIYDMQSMFSDKFVDESRLKIVGKIDDVIGSFNFTESYGRRIVKFCKSVPAFAALNDADQFVLFKSFYMGILGIRLSFLWDDKRSGYPVIANESGNKALFFCFENSMLSLDQKVLNDNKQLQRQIWMEMENDFTIRDLLIALFLFQQKENLKCCESVGYQYFVYSRLLRRYLEHKYRNIKQANQKFVKLCNLTEQMAKLKDVAQIVLSEIDSSAILPMVLELFE